MQKPSIGRIVHFRLSEDHVRPAVIVRDWGGGTLNLQVLYDGTNDVPGLGTANDAEGEFPTEDEGRAGLGWKTSIVEGDGVGQWSWPPRV